jgi:RNA polymerase sigma-70 factor, ECF subfamily
MTEKEIAAGCKKSNNKARKEMYERYRGGMFALILRYLPDRYQACDVLHDGFITVYTKISGFEWRGDGSLHAWMSRIFVNQVIGYLRLHDILRNAEDIDNTGDDIIDVNEDDVVEITSGQLQQMIETLPNGYRTVFNLYAIDGLSHKEIAQMLDISERTSSSQLFRAKKIMAKKIKELGIPNP